jgi:hypothetical protein
VCVCDVGVALKEAVRPCLQCQLPASTAAASGLGYASLSSQSPLLAASGCLWDTQPPAWLS